MEAIRIARTLIAPGRQTFPLDYQVGGLFQSTLAIRPPLDVAPISRRCRIDPSTALSQGETDANQAASLAKSAGFTDVVYDDMEGYDYTSSCDSAVTSYLNGWVYQLNQDGLVAGVYGSADSTIAGLVGHIGDSGMHEPAYI